MVPQYSFRLPCFALGLMITAFMILPAETVSAQKSRTTDRTIKVGKKKRTYILHLPKRYNKKQKKLIPMVLMLHGRGGTPRIASGPYYGDWKHLADKENFIAVFPAALGSPAAWESWGWQNSRDCKFLSKLIKSLIKEHRIDKNKVFMTGHSSGAYMSYCFAAAHGDKVAAIGPVSGLFIDRVGPKVSVSVIAIHGMSDQVVGYDRNYGKKAAFVGPRSAMESAEFFAKYNSCSERKRKDSAKGRIHVDTWAHGKNKTEVVLYSLEGGGHEWPHDGSRSINATKIIWKFFKSHPRPKIKTTTPKKTK